MLRVVGQSLLTQLAPDTTLSITTEWQLVRKQVVAVDPDGTGTEGVGDPDRGVEILGVDSRGKTINGVVGHLEDLLLGVELGDSADGAEDLFLHDLHLGADVGEDGGLDEVALVTVTGTTSLDCSALALAGLNVLHDTIILELRHLGALEGLGVEWVADLVRLSALLESGDELVVDAGLHVDTRSGAAALAVVEVDTKVDPADGLLDIGIVEDDIGRLAAQLEGDLLEVRRGSGLHDGAANNSGASKGDLVDVHVGRDGSAGSLPEARDDVENTGRETSLFDELSKDKTGQRRLLSGLENNSVTGSQSRSNFPAEHQKWEVPWDDLAADANLNDTTVSISSLWWLRTQGQRTGSSLV